MRHVQTKVSGNLHSNWVKVLFEHFDNELNLWWQHVTLDVMIYSEEISLSNWCGWNYLIDQIQYNVIKYLSADIGLF